MPSGAFELCSLIDPEADALDGRGVNWRTGRGHPHAFAAFHLRDQEAVFALAGKNRRARWLAALGHVGSGMKLQSGLRRVAGMASEALRGENGLYFLKEIDLLTT